MSRVSETLAKALRGELGAMRWAHQQLTGNARANHLLCVMGKRANKTFECWMSDDTMAEIMEVSPRTVQRALAHLLKLGFIEDISGQWPKRRTKTYMLRAPIMGCV